MKSYFYSAFVSSSRHCTYYVDGVVSLETVDLTVIKRDAAMQIMLEAGENVVASAIVLTALNPL